MSSDLLLRNFIEFIAEKQLIAKGERILIAVSGGVDSCVLTSLFHKTIYDFGIAHCNFSLRGKESDEDEEHVKNLSERLGKPFHVKKFDVKAIAESSGQSIQEAARKVRYEWFEEICDGFNYQKIATAHHFNDSIETFYINLSRHAGPAGLRGIPVRRGRIIRPLLFARKKDIESYAAEEEISYRTDSTNESDAYLRNRIRRNLIPRLKEKDPDLENTVKGMMEDYSVIYDTTTNLMEKWKKVHVRTDNAGHIHIPIGALMNEENNEYFLSFLLYTYGIIHIDCKKILAVKTPGKVFYGKNHIILRDRNFLVVKKREDNASGPITIHSLPAEFNTAVSRITFLEKEKTSFEAQHGVPCLHALDAAKIVLPLQLRKWQAGDSFHPLGMKGSKKVSDYFIDRKFNRFQKENTYLLLSGNNIVCILGHQIDDRFKITPETKRVLTIELHRK